MANYTRFYTRFMTGAGDGILSCKRRQDPKLDEADGEMGFPEGRMEQKDVLNTTRKHNRVPSGSRISSEMMAWSKVFKYIPNA